MWEIDCKKETFKRLVKNSYSGKMGSGIQVKNELGDGSMHLISPSEVERNGFLIACNKPM